MTPLTDRLKDLIAINRAIAASLDYEEVLRRVVEKTAEFTNADACLLLLATAENRASIVAQVGLDPARARAFVAPLNERIGAALRRVLELEEDVAFIGKPLVIRQGAVSGLLVVYRGSLAPQLAPVEEDFLLSALADQATIALDHALHFRDDHARLLERERAARAEAEEANHCKDDFLATLSHELRTPLNAVLGWTRMVRTGQLAPEKRDHALEIIERNALSQTQLIDDLLDVSRITSGKLRLDVRPTDMLQVLEAAADSMRPAMVAKGIKLVQEFDPRAGTISGDPARIQQVVWNLLSNATKFTPPGGTVTLILRAEANEVEISVNDTGEGMALSFLPLAFDRFRQADGRPTRAHGGLGLGLAISRHLVELHGGSIRVHSDGPGRGALFVVRLPRSGPAAQATRILGRASDEPLAEALREMNGLEVLVVDDEPDARDLVVAIVEKCGGVATSMASTEEAMASIRRRAPDVIVSDLVMPGPGGDGYALVRKVRALPSGKGGNIPAAAITGYAGREERRRAFEAGFQAHITKPLDASELMAALARLSRMARASA